MRESFYKHVHGKEHQQTVGGTYCRRPGLELECRAIKRRSTSLNTLIAEAAKKIETAEDCLFTF